MNQKSWKSTAGSIVATVMVGLSFMQVNGFITMPKWAVGIVLFAMLGGFASWGVNTKDADLTGGNRGTPSTLEALAAANQMPAPTAVPAPPLHSGDVILNLQPTGSIIASSQKPAPPEPAASVPIDREAALAAYKQKLSTIGVK